MKVAYDAFSFRMQKHGGISRYFEKLINEFASNTSYGVKPDFCEEIPEVWKSRLPEFGQAGKRSRVIFQNWLKLIDKRDGQPGDLLHLTYYSEPLRMEAFPRFTITLHDFTPEDFPKYFRKGNPHLKKLELMRSASGLICVSPYTASRAINYMPSVKNKIFVIPLASDIDKIEFKFETDYYQTHPYFLAVGRPDKYKNYETLLEIWLSQKTHRLMLFGVDKLPRELMKLIPNSRRNDIVFKQGSDAELREAYEGAACLISCSYSEGFAIPILEALSLGCPVVAPPLPLYKDLYSQSISYSEDFSVKSFQNAIDRLSDSSYRKDLSDYGLSISKKYSWQRTAKETALAYQAMCAS
jgi:glycosyltransferase involved in cell wall biosynthesis